MWPNIWLVAGEIAIASFSMVEIGGGTSRCTIADSSTGSSFQDNLQKDNQSPYSAGLFPEMITGSFQSSASK